MKMARSWSALSVAMNGSRALKLRLKGVAYRPRPKPPVEEVS